MRIRALSLVLAVAAIGAASRANAEGTVIVNDQVFFGSLLTPVFVSGQNGDLPPVSGTGYTATVGTSVNQSAPGEVQLHAHSSITTDANYHSGTNGRAEALVIGVAAFDLVNNTTNADLVGGRVVIHQRVDGTITSGDLSSIFASTSLSYQDRDGDNLTASGSRFLTGQGQVSGTYDLTLGAIDLGRAFSLGTFVFALSTNAVLANNALMPFASVDASNTAAIEGFSVYDAAGHYVPGFEFFTDFGSVREFDPNAPPPPTGGVPEPAAWALMLAGLGGIGAALRRRRSAAA